MPPTDTALQKRVKRHVIGRPQAFFAVTPPGLEELCRREIAAMPGTISQAAAVAGGVEFKGRLADLYGASLELRIPTRIIMRLAMFKSTNFRQLAKQLEDLPWELYLLPGAPLKVSVKTAHSRLYHTAAIARQIEASVVSRLEGVSVDGAGGHAGDLCLQTLHIRVLDDNFLVSLDASGEPLYKRGLKTDVGKAPLRETLSAAILYWAGWRSGSPLIDPMCGSGTFSLEAALMASRTPPGWFRSFAFMQWPAFKPGQWEYLKKERSAKIELPPRTAVFASDIDARACRTLESVVRKHDLAGTVAVNCLDFFSLRPAKAATGRGTVALNPPYGLRLGSARENKALYAEIALKLQRDFNGWRLALLLPDRRLAALFPSRLRHRTISHGGLHLTLLTGSLP